MIIWIRLLVNILGFFFVWLLVKNYRMFECMNKDYPKNEATTTLAYNVVVYFCLVVVCMAYLIFKR